MPQTAYTVQRDKQTRFFPLSSTAAPQSVRKQRQFSKEKTVRDNRAGAASRAEISFSNNPTKMLFTQLSFKGVTHEAASTRAVLPPTHTIGHSAKGFT